MVNDCVNARETIEALKSQLKATKPSKSDVDKAEIMLLKGRLNGLENKIVEYDETVKELERANMIAREGSNRLNMELKEAKLKFSQEKALIERQHKFEVKAWRKEFGESNKEKVKLEKKLEEQND